jgi:Flp pilus assembly protein TadG
MRRPERRAGFVLVTTGLSIVALIGMMGLAFDIGRMYIAKSEVQTFADLTAIAATRQLDGSDAGVTRARQQVAGSQMKWNFSTQPFTQNTVLFSSDGVTWNDGTTDVRNIKYVYVTSTVAIDLYFIPIVVPQPVSGVALLAISFRTSVKGSAAAGQHLIDVFAPGGPGLLPFAPLAHDSTDPNFGFHTGDIITLRWPSNVNGNKHFCDADNASQWVAQSTIGGGDERGFIQETSGNAIEEAVVDDRIFYTVTLGLPVTMTGGVKASQAASLIERANQDLDVTSTTHVQYLTRQHNDRRIGAVPIVDANDSFRVIGFAKVFLPMQQDQNGNKSLCAEYIGPYYLLGSDDNGSTGTGTGIFEVRLSQ